MPVNPAEDINNIKVYVIVFVPLRLDAGVFFLSVSSFAWR